MLGRRKRFGLAPNYVVFTLLVGLATRAIIPAGYMPGNLLAGELMVMCPAGGATTIALLQPKKPHQHPHHGDGSETRSADESCPIGLALLLDAISDVPAAPDATLQVNQPIKSVMGTQRLPEAARMYSTRAPPNYLDRQNLF